MNQHLHIITLGVKDFEKSRQFYTETLGWTPSSAGQGDIAFFQAGGMVFSIYPREKLGKMRKLTRRGMALPESHWDTTPAANPKWMKS